MRNIARPCITYSVQISGITHYTWRTKRLENILDTIGLETNAHQGKIIQTIFVPLNSSTMTLKVHYGYLPAVYMPRVLGIDDWDFHKGVCYDIILVDMQTSRVIDLLSSLKAVI